MKVFVVAMESEAAAILPHLTHRRELSVFGRCVVEGALAGERTAVVISGIGKVNAAAATQLALDRYAPNLLLNVGVVGGVDARLSVAELCIVSRAFQCDFDLSAVNGTPRGTPDEYRQPFFDLLAVPGFESVICATGDAFTNDDADRDFVVKEMGASVRDMELGAIAHVAARAGVPLASLKAVSDVHVPGRLPPVEQYRLNLARAVAALTEAVPRFFGVA